MATITGTSLTAAQHPQQLAAVEVGQAEVEHDEVGSVVDGRLQPGHRGAARRSTACPRSPQRPDQRRADRRVVLDEQDLGHDTEPAPGPAAGPGCRLCAFSAALTVRRGMLGACPDRPAPARTGLLAGLWLAAAAGAMLLGLSAVGRSAAASRRRDTADGAEEVDAWLAVAAPPPAARPAGATGAQTAVVPAGPAGTVLARCSGSTPSVVSVNPAQGFEASGDDDGGTGVKLESDEVKVRVALRCESGRPSGTASVEQDD